MKASFLLAACFLGLISMAWADAPVTLVIHGGAGIKREDLSAEREAECRATLVLALRAGFAQLKQGGKSVEAVKQAIVVLEDSPLFNAGRGSVLTADGTVEMDASLMDGGTFQAGAVAGVQGVRNPILLSELVMLQTKHVLLAGRGAEELARQHALRFEEPEWFIVPEQRARLDKARKKSAQLDAPDDFTLRIGTVGAVALDAAGHLAAGTSTGGLVNKRSGRVGDSPIIGAGTYAEDGVCAVSCTGHGEFFIRNAVAHDVAARMKYGKATLKEAAETVVNGTLKTQQGTGGLIAVDAQGHISTPFNTPGMFRAWMTADGVAHVAVFAE